MNRVESRPSRGATQRRRFWNAASFMLRFRKARPVIAPPGAGLFLFHGLRHPACSQACTDQQQRPKDSQGSKGRGNKNKPIPGSLSYFSPLAGGKGGIEKDGLGLNERENLATKCSQKQNCLSGLGKIHPTYFGQIGKIAENPNP